MGQPARHAATSLWAFALRAIVAVMLVGLGGAAAAQSARMGLSTALPAPISSRDLIRYAAAMDLSPEQMRAFGEAHDRYKTDFAQLGDAGGPIERFIESRKAADGIPFRIQPTREELNRWLASHQAIFSAIAALDGRLFDELSPLLVERQHALLHRVRLSRQRHRLISDELVGMWLVPAMKADPAEMFARMAAEVAPEVREAAWAALDEHQVSYVRRLGDLQETSRQMHRDWAASLEAEGVKPAKHELAQVPEIDQELFQTLARTWRAATDKPKPHATELLRANRAIMKSVGSLLEDRHRVLLMRRFFSTAYREILSHLDQFEVLLNHYRASDVLSNEEKSQLQQLHAAYERKLIEIAEEAADARDAMTDSERPHIGAGPGARQREQAARNAMEAEWEAASKAMRDLIGSERMRAMSSFRSDESVGKWLEARGITDPVEAQIVNEVRKNSRSFYIPDPATPDSQFPGPVSDVGLRRLAEIARLAPEQRDELEPLRAQYVRRYRPALNEAMEKVEELRIGFMHREQPGGQGMASYAPVEDVEKAIAIEREALERLRQFDDEFLAACEAALAETEAGARFWRARLWRELAALARGGRQGVTDLRAYEAYVPLVEIVYTLPLRDDEAAAADRVLAAMKDQWLGLARAHLEANRTAWHARDIALAHSSGPVRSEREVTERKERDSHAAERTADDRRHALAAFVRSVLDELCEALPAHAAALRDGWERAAYPKVFSDADAAGPLLAQALGLPNLTEPQRTDLAAAAAKFHPAHRDVSERLIAANIEWDHAPAYTDEGRAQRDRAKYRWDQLVFERDEVNWAARFALQRILLPAQREAIGLRDADAAGGPGAG